jgi:hypothetical protein
VTVFAVFPGGAPLAVKILGEELVLFRDDKGVSDFGDSLLARGELEHGQSKMADCAALYHGWL